ncbi:hypothetical protein [Texcoconibacillus texcoconensis]|uniref:Uncharacterized protein n=1 Tax=Texcoconibacillus texcoconensis TaxID=1095777 RepID=A0A840QQJ9_9BACI|nr:hypothetical protein [Texcoconibacillus texcoconensis]MBB5173645.1 hypothetical protein [Texcoconibacillus texcoconensis]
MDALTWIIAIIIGLILLRIVGKILRVIITVGIAVFLIYLFVELTDGGQIFSASLFPVV